MATRWYVDPQESLFKFNTTEYEWTPVEDTEISRSGDHDPNIEYSLDVEVYPPHNQIHFSPLLCDPHCLPGESDEIHRCTCHTRPPRLQFRGAEMRLVPSHSTDDQDPSVWNVDNNILPSFFNHVLQRQPPGRGGKFFLHHSLRPSSGMMTSQKEM
ncbi:unnamed protein product [Hymenolepis diminuta]|uniref:WW domain-containing protein n=1 Tax=Hymenolepis diminuta TaxID=6216 RepID=A0A0R3SX44_HYMDI|nr:unnamed protein product [Hymenolepis diminuta]